MADRKVKLIIEVDDKDAKAAEASLNRLGIAAKNVGKAGSDDLKNFEASAKNASLSLAGMGPVGAVLATILAGVGVAMAAVAAGAVRISEEVYAASKAFAEYGTRIGLINERTGVAVSTLSGLDTILLSLGGSSNDAENAIEAFYKQIDKARGGSKEATRDLKELGITGKGAAGDIDAAFAKAIKRIYEAPDGFEKNRLAVKAFGEEVGGKMIPVINRMHGDLAEAARMASEFGTVLSDDDVLASKQFNEAMQGAKLAVQGLTYTVGREFLPEVTDALRAIEGYLMSNKDAVRSVAVYTSNAVVGIVSYWNDAANAVARYNDAVNSITGGSSGAFRKFSTLNEFGTISTMPILGPVPYISNQAGRLMGKGLNTAAERGEQIRNAQPLTARAAAGVNIDEFAGSGLSGGTGKGRGGGGRVSKAAKTERELSARAKAILEGAQKLGIDFEDYATLMLYETAGTLNPWQKGPVTKWGQHRGTIQYGESQARAYGVTANQSFYDQVTGSNVRYLKDRGVRPGADLLTLYKAVNGGNVSVSANATDVNARGERTSIADHVVKMKQQYGEKAKAMFQGVKSSGKSIEEDVQRMLEKQSDTLTKDARDSLLDSAIKAWQTMGLIPDGGLLSEFQRRMADINRSQGTAQPTDAEVIESFRLNATDRAMSEIDNTSPVALATTVQNRLNADQQYIQNLRIQLGLQSDQIEGETRYTQLVLRERNVQAEIEAELQSITIGQKERVFDANKELEILGRMNVAEEARTRAVEERVYISREIQDLQIELANQGKNDGLKIEAAYLRDILEMRNRELDAVIATNRAQLELSKAMEISSKQIRAGVYEHMAAQKTVNKGIVDGINGTYDAILSRMNEPLDKLNEKSKGLLSFVTEPLKAMQAQGLNKIFSGIIDRILPGSSPLKDALKTTGNPVLDEAKKQTDLLTEIRDNMGGRSGLNSTTGGGIGGIFSNIFGGSGRGGTPNFNPTFGNFSPNGNSNALGGGLEGLMTGGLPGVQGSPSTSWLAGIKGMFKPQQNPITGNMNGKTAGVMGGIGSIAGMAGGLIGGKWGNVLSMAGQGMSIGSMFGPWGSVIGAGAGALIGWFMGGSDKSEARLREAALSEFSISVKDKSVLRQLKGIGEGMFGKGKVGENAISVVRSEPGMNILRAYAESTGQSGLKVDRINYGDPNWKGNDFRTQFGGFRANGGSVMAGMSYVVGEKRPELFVPSVNGTIMPAVPNVTTTGGDPQTKQMLQNLHKMIGQMVEVNDGLRSEISRLRDISPDRVVAMGAAGASREVADAYESELDGDGTRGYNLSRLTGANI